MQESSSVGPFLGIHSLYSCGGSLPNITALHHALQCARILWSICSFGTGSTKKRQFLPTISSISYPTSFVNPVEHPISGQSFSEGSAMVKENSKPRRLLPVDPKMRSTASCNF